MWRIALLFAFLATPAFAQEQLNTINLDFTTEEITYHTAKRTMIVDLKVPEVRQGKQAFPFDVPYEQTVVRRQVILIYDRLSDLRDLCGLKGPVLSWTLRLDKDSDVVTLDGNRTFEVVSEGMRCKQDVQDIVPFPTALHAAEYGRSALMVVHYGEETAVWLDAQKQKKAIAKDSQTSGGNSPDDY